MARIYYEYHDRGHFGGDYFKPDFPELLQALKQRLYKDLSGQQIQL